jgi:pyridoxal phosphate enzyme (YggS family)
VLDPIELSTRLAGVRERIARAARRAQRDPDSIRLVAVSKTFPAADVRAAAALGQVDFGENRVQEALPKMEQTADLPLRWHLVGHLQSNKVRKAVNGFSVIHSIDSASLIARVEQAAQETGRQIEFLVQVDLAGEATKHGIPPEQILSVIEPALRCRAARLTGLMLLPPAVDDPEAVRPHFVALRLLRDKLVSSGVPPTRLAQLSMGMSHDFEVAVEEGATLLRIGTAIFAERPGALPPL